MTMITTGHELRSEATIYSEGTTYTTDDLVRAYNDYVAECQEAGQEADDCQRFFERLLEENPEAQL